MSHDALSNEGRFVFIGGLHRSGTSLLHQSITDHPAINRFRKTNVPQDEGQYLQSVYPDDYHFGGPGRFGFVDAAHFTEDSPLATPDNAARIMHEWSKYWEKDAAIYAEKTPRNLIISRFLKKLFPRAIFVFLVRHPVAVAMATRKWAISPLSTLVLHWLACHERLLEDIEHLDDYLVFRYEDFLREPQQVVDTVYQLVGVPSVPLRRSVRIDGNSEYEKSWQELERWSRLKRYSFAERYRSGERSDSRMRRILRQSNRQLGRFGWSDRVQVYMPYAEVDAVGSYLRPQFRRFGFDIEDGCFRTLEDSVLPFTRIGSGETTTADETVVAG